MKFGLGQSALRVEDMRFLRGLGRYSDDISLAGQACGYLLRSPHAHARIRAIDTRGVGADCAATGCCRTGLGDRGAADRAFAPPHHVPRMERPFPRAAVNAREPRAALGENSATDGRYPLHTANQMPHDLRA